MAQLHLFKDRRFWPLFWTQFFGALNDNVFKNALVIYIAFKGISVFGLPPGSVVALGGGVFILPFFIFSAQAGYLADKFEKSGLVKKIKIAEIILMGCGALFLLIHQMELLLLVLFAMGTQSTYFGPIKYSILPQLVDDENLVGANAVVEAGTFLAILLGTIIGGVSIALNHGEAVVAAEVIVFAVCGWCTSLFLVKLTPSAPNVTVPFEPLRPTIKIIRETRSNKSVYLSIMGISWFWFLGAAILTLFPTYAKDILHGDESVVTWMLTLFSLGICFGSLLCERLSRRMLELGLVPLGTIGMTFFLFLLYIVGQPLPQLAAVPMDWLGFLGNVHGIVVSAALFLFSLFGGFYIVPLYTLMQQRSDAEDRSRVIASNNIINALFMVVASVMLMIFAMQKIGPVETYFILAAMNIAVSLFVYAKLPEFLLRFICFVLVKGLYRLRIVNREALPLEGAAVIVANHVSFLDWMILASASPRPIRVALHHSFMKHRWIQFLYREAKVIPVADHGEDQAISAEARVMIHQALAAGELVVIFPEEQLTKTGEIGPFSPELATILNGHSYPVIPVAIRGMWGSLFSKAKTGAVFGRLFGRISLVIGEAFPAESFDGPRLREAVVQLRGQET